MDINLATNGQLLQSLGHSISNGYISLQPGIIQSLIIVMRLQAFIFRNFLTNVAWLIRF